MNPEISVLMAVNREDEFLDSAIESILNQSFFDFEFIIVANNCEDGLWSKLMGYKDSRLRLFRIPLGGLANALNFGLCHVNGKYVARMDADDISLPLRLETQYRFLESNPAVVLVGCDSRLIDSNDVVISQRFKYYGSDSDIRSILPLKNPILHPAIMIRHITLLNLGGYKYGGMSEDHELFIRMARSNRNKFYNINEILFHYRRHPNQITDISRAKKNFCEISGFLFTEFLLTFNFKYVLGMCIVSPFGRKTISLCRRFKKIIFKNSGN